VPTASAISMIFNPHNCKSAIIAAKVSVSVSMTEIIPNPAYESEFLQLGMEKKLKNMVSY